jgi:23S rRNA (guanosine2251-2'-O)-methyltransferase
VYDTDLKGGFALIMGSEGKGINPSVLKMVDTQVHIPIAEEVDSLNVAVASAVILFEAQRQRMA